MKPWVEDTQVVNTSSDLSLADWVTRFSGPVSGPIGKVPVGGPHGTLGRYVLLEKLGEGGMGAVYRAFDPELSRMVAIKLLREDIEGSPDDGARLLREGQAMARLSHANVVTIHDVGRCDGRLFVAMELVEGGMLRSWLDGTRSWQEILDAFLQAGRGLAAAHAAGLVHRDFKPENVLVGADGRICVTDFGLARRSQEQALPSTLEGEGDLLSTCLTEAGVVMGTAHYMAPEQFTAGTTDPRTDQFSFCIALFEELYGVHPFAGELFTRMARARNGQIQAPPKGTKVPARVHRVLTRGLSGNPEARYPTMEALLQDLAGVPVAIRRRWVAGGAVAAAALLAAGTHHQVRRARTQVCKGRAEQRLAQVWNGSAKNAIATVFRSVDKPFATTAWQRVEQSLDKYAAEWTGLYNAACESTWVAQEQTPTDYSEQMRCLEWKLDDLGALAALFAKADAQVIENAQSAILQLHPLQPCAQLSSVGPGSGFHGPELEALRSALSRARALFAAGKYKDGVGAASNAVTLARELKAEVAYALLLLGEAQFAQADFGSAERSLREADRAAEAMKQDRTRAKIAIVLARVLGVGLQRIDDAREWAARAEAVIHRVGGDQALEADLHAALSAISARAGEVELAVEHATKALMLRERMLSDSDMRVADSLDDLGIALFHQGRSALAIPHFERALTVLQSAFGVEHPRPAMVMLNLAAAELELGRRKEALNRYRQLLDFLPRLLGPEHADVGDVNHNIAEVYLEMHNAGAALEHYRRALAIHSKSHGKSHPDLAFPLSGMGRALLLRGDAVGAIRVLERALRLIPASSPYPDLKGEAQFALAQGLWTQGEDERARRLALAARQIFQSLGSQGVASAQDVSNWLSDKRGGKSNE
jgi:tetratricopeptide (TPR) repeat protein